MDLLDHHLISVSLFDLYRTTFVRGTSEINDDMHAFTKLSTILELMKKIDPSEVKASHFRFLSDVIKNLHAEITESTDSKLDPHLGSQHYLLIIQIAT